MIDYSMQTVVIDGESYRTNGINIVRHNGCTVTHGSVIWRKAIAAFIKREILMPVCKHAWLNKWPDDTKEYCHKCLIERDTVAQNV